MVQLSRAITEETETDYDGNNTTYKRVAPLFDGACKRIVKGFPTSTSDADCKTAIKNDILTVKGYTWDTEI